MKNLTNPQRVTRNGENLLIIPAGMTGKELKEWKKQNPKPEKKGNEKKTVRKINNEKKEVAVSMDSLNGKKDFYIFKVDQNIFFKNSEAKIIGFSDDNFVFVSDKKGKKHSFPIVDIFFV